MSPFFLFPAHAFLGLVFEGDQRSDFLDLAVGLDFPSEAKPSEFVSMTSSEIIDSCHSGVAGRSAMIA